MSQCGHTIVINALSTAIICFSHYNSNIYDSDTLANYSLEVDGILIFSLYH